MDINSSGSKIYQRKSNFSDAEKELLLCLVDGYKDIVDNTYNDRSSMENKVQAWDTIATQYNSFPCVRTDRTPDQLKKLFQNLKSRARYGAKHREDHVPEGRGVPEDIVDHLHEDRWVYVEPDPPPSGCLDEAISIIKEGE